MNKQIFTVLMEANTIKVEVCVRAHTRSSVTINMCEAKNCLMTEILNITNIF